MRGRSAIITICAFASIFTLASYKVFKTSGAHPGSTGAPGNLTCAQMGCHSDATVDVDSGFVNNLVFSSPDTTYVPGGNYTLTLNVFSPSIQKFGFELLALKDSSNTNVGTFVVIENTRTQKITHYVGSDLRYTMTHRTAGTPALSPGSTQWQMRWNAPASNVGTVTFYYATNCTNNNGFETGDRIYLSSLRIRAAKDTTTTGIAEQQIVKAIAARYVKEKHAVVVQINSASYQEAKIMVFDTGGKLAAESSAIINAGQVTSELALPAEIAGGTYIVKLITQDASYSAKVIVN
jgi:hypothetical protein